MGLCHLPLWVGDAACYGGSIQADGRDGAAIANRGPKTEAGKKAVRRNALKHGLRAVTPVVEDVEVPEIWEAHLQGMFDSLQPEGYHEKELAGRIAELLWRLRRVSVYETEMINSALHKIPRDWVYQRAMDEYAQKVAGIEPEPPSVERLHRAIGVRMLPGDVTRITRYEAHLHRLYIQTLHELEALQARRRGERVPLARLDITGAPGG